MGFHRSVNLGKRKHAKSPQKFLISTNYLNLVLCRSRRRDEVGGNRGEVPRRLGLCVAADPRPGSDPLLRGVSRTWRPNRSPQREGKKKAYPPRGG